MTKTNKTPETSNQSEAKAAGLPSAESIADSLGFSNEAGAGDAIEGTAAETETGESGEEELAEGEAGTGGENAGDDESEGAEGSEGAEEGEEEDAGESEEEESSEESDESEHDEGDEELPKSVPKLQKRVGKLTKKLRETEEERDAVRREVEELTGRLEKAEVTVLQPSPDNPLADVSSEADVTDRLSQMKAVRRWCQANPDGGEVQGKDGLITLTAEQVRERLAYAEDVIDAAPDRLAYLQQEKQNDEYAKVKYPELFKTNSQERKLADNFLRMNPGIKRLPNWRLIIGDALRGMQVRLAEEKAKTNTTAKPVVKPKVPAVKAGNTPVTTVRKAGADKATSRFLETGRSSDLVGAIEAGLLN